MALSLGQLATLLERFGDAERHFQTALRRSEQMRARPWRANVRYEFARMLLARDDGGDAPRARSLLDEARTTAQILEMPILLERVGAAIEELVRRTRSRSMPASAPSRAGTPLVAGDALFRCEGHFWTIEHGGRELRLKDSKGLRYLAHLLRHPGQELLALDVATQTSSVAESAADGDATAAVPAGSRNGGVPALDALARLAYRRRLEDLRAELEEAERCNDAGRCEKSRNEIEFLAHELRAATGIGGRDRPSGSVAERARFAVTKGIKTTLKKIAELDPHLGHHLGACVKTGAYCSYTPPPGQR